MKLSSYLKQKLKSRRAASIGAIIIGVILVAFARRSMHKVEEAKSTADHVGDFFTNKTGIWDPVVKFFGGQVHEEISKYDAILLTLLVIGVVLVALGAISLFWPRRR